METLGKLNDRDSTNPGCAEEARVETDSSQARTVDKAAAWLRLAIDTAIVRRACGYAVIVGAVLITINHGDAILAGEIDGRRLAKMGLTVVVPYVVSTLSSVGAVRALRC